MPLSSCTVAGESREYECRVSYMSLKLELAAAAAAVVSVYTGRLCDTASAVIAEEGASFLLAQGHPTDTTHSTLQAPGHFSLSLLSTPRHSIFPLNQ